ncbi:MAG: PKD domain-containing protein, partial [Bacteroidia bacterium]|nr:PKD domain-containing protein [Bacteroidia bacterium]
FNLSQNATDYLWFFDDGNTSNQHSPVHTYEEVGFYNVMLVAYNGEDCSDTAVKKIEVYQDFFFYIPNAFTTDNDGLNETFKPIGTGFKPETFEMKIFGMDMFRIWSHDTDCFGRVFIGTHKVSYINQRSEIRMACRID